MTGSCRSSEYVTTAFARDKIRRWFRGQEREENIAHGREILERELQPAQCRARAG